MGSKTKTVIQIDEGWEGIITEKRQSRSIGGHRVYMVNAETESYSMDRVIWWSQEDQN